MSKCYYLKFILILTVYSLLFIMFFLSGSKAIDFFQDSKYSNYDKEYKSDYYNIYFRNNTNTAEGIRFERNGYYFTYDISGSSMQWRATSTQPDATNTLGGGVSSNSQNTQVQVNGNKIIYPNAFSNTNLTYTLSKKTIKENFILYSLPSIKDYLFLEYTGHIYFNKSLTICSDGKCYKPSGTQDDFKTSGKIYFNDVNNRTQFYLDKPIITDSAGKSVLGEYIVRGSNAQMEYAIRIPQEFIKTAIYPIFIDPTIIIIPPAEHLNETFGFIEDIYDRISKLDNNVSLISNNHYVNLTFEMPLDKTKDITIYAKSNTSLSSVEIYRQNLTLITTINNISNISIAQYQALLYNLNDDESYSSFLLKITGDLIIDYIIDPVTFAFISPTPIDKAGITTNSFPTNVSIYDDCTGGGIIPTWYLDGVINYTAEQLPLCEDPTTYYYNYTYTSLSEGNHTYYFAGGESGDTGVRTIYYDINTSDINFVNQTPLNASIKSINSIFVNISSNDSSPHFVLNQFNNTLISWWRMDDINASGDPTDYFGRNNASKIGTAIQNYGQYGKGFDLSGQGYLKVNNIPFNSNPNLSIFAWIVPTNIGGGEQQPLHFKGDNSITRIQMYKPNNSPNLILLINAGCIGGSITATGVLANNVWTHVGYTRVANYSGSYSNFTFYVNGINKGTRLCNGTFETTTTDLWIGSENGNTLNWTGVIDEVVLYNRSISQTEINSLMNSTNNQYYNNFTDLTDGTYNFKGYAADKSGNLNSTDQRIVSIDTTFPSFSNNKTNLTTSTNLGSVIYFNITITETNPSSYIFSWYNGTGWENSTGSYINGEEINIIKQINIDIGNINWTWYANDTAGNINQSQVYGVTLIADDSIPPNVTIIYPINGSYYSLTSITFNLTVVDNIAVSSCLYSLNNGINNFTMSNITQSSFIGINSSIADGIYTANFYCNDTNGNLNNSEKVIFTIDTTPPTVEIISPINNSILSFYEDVSVLLNVTSSDVNNVSSYWYRLDGGSNISFINFTTININQLNGSTVLHNLIVYVNDTNNNINSSVIYFTTIQLSHGGGGGGSAISNINNRLYNFNVTYESQWNSSINDIYINTYNVYGKLIDIENLNITHSIGNFTYVSDLKRIDVGKYRIRLSMLNFTNGQTNLKIIIKDKDKIVENNYILILNIKQLFKESETFLKLKYLFFYFYNYIIFNLLLIVVVSTIVVFIYLNKKQSNKVYKH